ncbi:hypothetical protein, partial [Klebsiella pneumoniae]|uniref:hypothetical protein n=1 Tax=Klebsiella pneumoniae TaxID=573 RepID=UPI001D0F1C1C
NGLRCREDTCSDPSTQQKFDLFNKATKMQTYPLLLMNWVICISLAWAPFLLHKKSEPSNLQLLITMNMT